MVLLPDPLGPEMMIGLFSSIFVVSTFLGSTADVSVGRAAMVTNSELSK